MKPILLVEDNPDDVFFTRRALKRANIPNPLIVIDNGAEALRFLEHVVSSGDRELYPEPGLVLLDVNLPYVSGLEIARWIRSQSRLENLHVVIMVASPEAKEAALAAEFGANSYLIKPPAVEKLQELTAVPQVS